MVGADTMHVPFQIGGGGGAGLDIDIAVAAEGRDHEDIGADDRFVRKHLIDAQVPAMTEASPGLMTRTHGTRNDIEEAANDRRAFRKPGQAGSLLRHLADNVSRFHATGKNAKASSRP